MFIQHLLFLELDVCVYLMSAIGVKMEVEEGTSATVTDLICALVDEEELNLPRQTSTTSNSASGSGPNGGAAGMVGNIHALGEIFTLWMTSPLLDVQLKPHHKVIIIEIYHLFLKFYQKL